MEEVFEVDSGSYNKHGLGRRGRVVRKGRRSRKRMDEDSGQEQAVLAKLSKMDNSLGLLCTLSRQALGSPAKGGREGGELLGRFCQFGELPLE